MKKILVILVTGLLLCSCEDFLDTKNYTKKDTSNFPQTAEDAEQMIAGIYNALNSAFADADNQAYSKSQLFLSEIASDERYGSAGQNDPLWQALDKLMNYGYDMMMAAWKIPYQGIFRCNTAIKALPNCVGFRPGQLEEYTGEAYFLRGYFFFNLAQVFENVPLPVDPDPANLPQSPVEDTYGQIVSDLQQAIELLPSAKSSFPSKGHATKWAAEALMARVFLFYTGYYGKSELPVAGGGSISKSQVISWLEDCINNSGHDLLSDFRSLWPYANPYAKEKYKYITDAEVAERKTIPAWPGDGHRETVFATNFSNFSDWGTSTGFSNNVVLAFSMRQGDTKNGSEVTFPFYRGWGAGCVSTNIWNDWDDSDIRKKASILDARTEYPAGYSLGGDNQWEETGYWQKKYTGTSAYDNDRYVFNYGVLMYGFPDDANKWSISNTQDVVHIRYADVLLMHSELKEDATGLNRVRDRAGLPPISYSLDAIKRERRFELAFEGVRYYDLMRWGDAADALGRQNGSPIYNGGVETTMKEFAGGYKARYQATGGFFPIPESQIALSEGVLVQNKGWGSDGINYTGW